MADAKKTANRPSRISGATDAVRTHISTSTRAKWGAWTTGIGFGVLVLEWLGVPHWIPALLGLELPGGGLQHVLVALLPITVGLTLLAPDVPKAIAGLRKTWSA